MTTIDTNGNITHIKGDTFALTFTSVKQDGVTINWTGYTMKFTAKEYPGATPIISLTQTSGINLSTNGQISIRESASTMAGITPKNYVYDLEVTDASGNVDTWFNNKNLTVLQDIA